MQLKRFITLKNGGARKNSKKVNFDEELNITPFLSSEDAETKPHVALKLSGIVPQRLDQIWALLRIVPTLRGILNISWLGWATGLVLTIWGARKPGVKRHISRKPSECGLGRLK
jgi:hypothetical protein